MAAYQKCYGRGNSAWSGNGILNPCSFTSCPSGLGSSVVGNMKGKGSLLGSSGLPGNHKDNVFSIIIKWQKQFVSGSKHFHACSHFGGGWIQSSEFMVKI